MKRYRVKFEYRTRGAIGKYGIAEKTIAARDEETARNKYFDELQARGFETRAGKAMEIKP